MRGLILALFVAAQTHAAAAGTCSAVSSVRVARVTATRYLNLYHLTATVTNVGASPQPGDALQFVDIDDEYGQRLDDRGIPPLASGESYRVRYVWKRASDAGSRTTRLVFRIRTVSPPSMNDCAAAKASYSIVF